MEVNGKIRVYLYQQNLILQAASIGFEIASLGDHVRPHAGEDSNDAHCDDLSKSMLFGFTMRVKPLTCMKLKG